MSNYKCVVPLGVLAAVVLFTLPRAEAATLDTDVNVNITVAISNLALGWNPAATDDIAAGNEGGDVTWAIAGAAFSGIYDTVTSNVENMSLQNYGGTACDVQLQITNDGTTWNVAAALGNNAYLFWYSLDSGGSWTGVTDTATHNTMTGVGTLAVGATQDFDLKIQLPTGGATSETIVVTLTAVVDA